MSITVLDGVDTLLSSFHTCGALIGGGARQCWGCVLLVACRWLHAGSWAAAQPVAAETVLPAAASLLPPPGAPPRREVQQYASRHLQRSGIHIRLGAK